jgi:hypothetical protein
MIFITTAEKIVPNRIKNIAVFEAVNICPILGRIKLKIGIPPTKEKSIFITPLTRGKRARIKTPSKKVAIIESEIGIKSQLRFKPSLSLMSFKCFNIFAMRQYPAPFGLVRHEDTSHYTL